MSTSCVPGSLIRLVRGHGLTRSPLRRGTDRVEAWVTVGALVLVLCVVLLAVVVAVGFYQRAQTQAVTKAADQTSVTAVLLTNAATPPADSSGQGGAGQATAVVRWSLPNGQQRTGPLWVYTYRHAGDRISIWIDARGNRVDSPKTLATLIADAVGYGILLFIGGGVLVALLWWSACGVLGRINATRWGLDWSRRGSGWSRQTW
ncbi:MAG: hypothetical protein JO287_09355 [Pseudonocardiales bacterium]|nr:hypothetical protein [Pseudonocardiales bacterium]